jgi:hypothetical protein
MVRSACIILINSGFPRLVSLFCTVGLGTNDMAELELLSVVALTGDLLTKRLGAARSAPLSKHWPQIFMKLSLATIKDNPTRWFQCDAVA